MHMSVLVKKGGIVYKSVYGESAAVNQETVTDWIEYKLPKIIEKYKSRDIFNADETGLFYRCDFIYLFYTSK